MDFRVELIRRRRRTKVLSRNLQNVGVTADMAHLEFTTRSARYKLYLDKDTFKIWAKHVLPELF